MIKEIIRDPIRLAVPSKTASFGDALFDVDIYGTFFFCSLVNVKESDSYGTVVIIAYGVAYLLRIAARHSDKSGHHIAVVYPALLDVVGARFVREKLVIRLYPSADLAEIRVCGIAYLDVIIAFFRVLRHDKIAFEMISKHFGVRIKDLSAGFIRGSVFI